MPAVVSSVSARASRSSLSRAASSRNRLRPRGPTSRSIRLAPHRTSRRVFEPRRLTEWWPGSTHDGRGGGDGLPAGRLRDSYRATSQFHPPGADAASMARILVIEKDAAVRQLLMLQLGRL